VLEIAAYGRIACLGAIALVIVHAVKRGRESVGLPVAYVILLGLIHIPGAFAYVSSGGKYAGILAGGDYAAIGIGITAIGMWSFVGGLLLVPARKRTRTRINEEESRPPPHFTYYALVVGWIAAFAATPLTAIPTLGAAIVFGSAIWMLAVVIGLRSALEDRNARSGLLWLGAMMVYPIVALVFGGFVSHGTTAVIIILCSLLSKIRKATTVLIVLPFGAFLGISLFVNYYEDRTALRAVAWSDAGVGSRISAVSDTFSNFRLFDVEDPKHLGALAERLNQNEFVGLSYARLQNGESEYLQGRTFADGAISIIPRIIWPDKPVYGGSPAVISDMTGLRLNRDTSWGVGNVMEFYINFGFWSLVPAFVVLGALLGWLDRQTHLTLSSKSYARAPLYFLPGVALIQPNGSMVELVGGTFAALLAAHFWLQIWRSFVLPRRQDRKHSSHRIRRRLRT
jgi:hypothetical protein